MTEADHGAALIRKRARGARRVELEALLAEHGSSSLLTADAEGKTAVHHAAECSPHRDSVDLLISCSGGASALEAKCELDMLPIHWACKRNPSIGVIQLLIELGGDDTLQARDIMHCLPVHHAAQANANAEVVQHLVEKGGNGMLSATDAMGMLPIHLAGDNTKEVYQRLASASPRTLVARDTHGNRAKHAEVDSAEMLSSLQHVNESVRSATVEQVRETIQEFSPQKRLSPRTPGTPRVVEAAEAAEADTSVPILMPWESADEQGLLPLHHAVQHNVHVDAVQLLLDEAGGPAVLTEKTAHGLLPIHLAARSNTSPEVMKFLIQEGGRDTLDVRDHAGKLPLHHAAECNASPAAFRVLLLAGGLGALRVKDNHNRGMYTLQSPPQLDFQGGV